MPPPQGDYFDVFANLTDGTSTSNYFNQPLRFTLNDAIATYSLGNDGTTAVRVSPSTAGTINITAAFDGSATRLPSSANTSVTVRDCRGGYRTAVTRWVSRASGQRPAQLLPAVPTRVSTARCTDDRQVHQCQGVSAYLF
jgi:hypothetical protein